VKTAVRAFLALSLLVSPLHAKDLTLRAGELLLCTLDEPNFSSAVAEVGEPTYVTWASFASSATPPFRGAAISPDASRIFAIPAASSAKAGWVSRFVRLQP